MSGPYQFDDEPKPKRREGGGITDLGCVTLFGIWFAVFFAVLMANIMTILLLAHQFRQGR